MLTKIILWIMRKAFKSNTIRPVIAPVITEMYQKIASDNLIIESEIVPVKKGKRKYDLLII